MAWMGAVSVGAGGTGRRAMCRPAAPAQPGGSGAALEAAALALGEAAPDAEALVVFERVFKALGAHVAGAAHLLGLPGGATLLREEGLRIRLRAQRTVLPRHAPGVVLADTKDVKPQW